MAESVFASTRFSRNAIAAPEALDFIRRHLPDTVSIWVGAIDRELTAQSYIVPGLGDAGDGGVAKA